MRGYLQDTTGLQRACTRENKQSYRELSSITGMQEHANNVSAAILPSILLVCNVNVMATIKCAENKIRKYHIYAEGAT